MSLSRWNGAKRMGLSALSRVWGGNRIVAVGMTLLALALAGCAYGGPSLVTATPTSTLAPLPTLQPEKGYITALALSNDNGGGRMGSFIASKPYDISFFCEGSGNLYLTYDTNMGEIKLSTSCSSSPQPNGTQTWPATGEKRWSPPPLILGFAGRCLSRCNHEPGGAIRSPTTGRRHRLRAGG